MAKILYVAGYGRSGSTILDIILSNHSKIAGVGEVSNLLDDWANPARPCSCGKPYQVCEFWRDLLEGFSPCELSQLSRSVARATFVPSLLSNLISNEDRTNYARYERHLFQYIESHTSKSIIVDSSKSARTKTGRFLALQRLAHHDVYVLHLVRNGLDTMASLVVTGSNRALEHGLSPPRSMPVRSVTGWVIANLSASLLGRILGPGHYHLLRYEDFLASPADALRKIGEFCGFDPEELIVRIYQNDYFHVGHRVGGNRIRFQRQVRLRRENEMRQREGLRAYHRLLFFLVGGWLQRRYGYLRS